MEDIYSRTALIIGDEALEKLKSATVAVFGIGGVGSYTVEALARAGIGHLILIDSDCVSKSNINRQLIALHSTVGKSKVHVMQERIYDINPNIKAEAIQINYNKDTYNKFNLTGYSYIADAIDTVTSKLLLIKQSNIAHVPIISCMGAGNKLDPTKFEVTDIYKTSVCPLARVMRRELKKMEINKLKVVYSKEEPVKTGIEDSARKRLPGSISFVPSVAGLIIAGEVVKDLIKKA